MFYLDGVIFLGTLEDFFSLLDLDAVVIIFDNGKWRATGRSGSKRWYEVDAAVGISILEALQGGRLAGVLLHAVPALHLPGVVGAGGAGRGGAGTCCRPSCVRVCRGRGDAGQRRIDADHQLDRPR